MALESYFLPRKVFNEITLILFVVVRDVGDVFADEGC